MQDFRNTYSEMESFQRARIYYSEAAGVNIELFQVALRMVKMAKAFQTQGAAGDNANLGPNLTFLRDFYPEFDPALIN